MIYLNSKNTEIRAKLKLRSTTQGANNRLDVESIVSFDKADGISTPVIGMVLAHFSVMLTIPPRYLFPIGSFIACIAGGQQDSEEEEDLQQFLQQPGTRAHKRGTSPFVFVQWDHVAGSNLNLPVGKMDFYVAG